MMTFKMIKNVERFLELVNSSRGEVALVLPNGTQCDLKKNGLVQEMLRLMRPDRQGITLCFSEGRDRATFLQYMMEANLW